MTHTNTHTYKQTNTSDSYTYIPISRIKTFAFQLAFGNLSEHKRYQKEGCGDAYIRSKDFYVMIVQLMNKAVTLSAPLPSRTLSALHNKRNLNTIQRMSTNRPLSLYPGCDNDILIKLGHRP
jgi:hypothetical protein